MSDEADYRIELPYERGSNEWSELLYKGVIQIRVEVRGVFSSLTFYDQSRLAGQASLEIEKYGYFFEENVVVLPFLDVASIELAVKKLYESQSL